MTYKLLIKALIVGMTAFLLTSCFPDNELIYDGPLQVEFQPTSGTQRMSDGTSHTASIQLIGPHQSEPLTVSFIVDTENSTAVEGVHFTIDGNSTVIPPNSSFGSIVVHAIEENIDATRPVLRITLIDSDDVRAARNYDTYALTLRP